LICTLVVSLLAACTPTPTPTVAPAPSAAPAASAPPLAPQPTMDNPLLARWSGNFGGVPPFDAVKVEHFEPALTAAMDLARKDIDAIAKSPDAPTFENTIAKLEDSSRTLNDVSSLFGIWSSSMNDDAFQKVELKMAPVLSAFSDEITQNAALFKRIEAVYNSPEKAKLTPEQQRLTWLTYTSYVRAGAKLDAAAKKRVADINQRLATLYTEFSQNLLADEDTFILLESEADLAGLPEPFRQGAAAAAEAKGKKGKWAITNTRSSVEPFLEQSTKRELREKVWKAFVQRGDNGDAHDNKARITEILGLRVERAKLLGFPTHAHWRLEDSMAKTPEKAMTLMEAVWKPAVLRVHEEVADMQAIADKEGTKIKIAPWDYRHYAEKVRKAKYDLDQNEIKPYLQLDKLREALFFVAGELFGFTFSPLTGIPVYHADLTVYEVKDKTTGKHVGLWYFDPYARPGKHSGAWMNAYRNQERFKTEVTTIVSNNANFVKAKPGEAVLISWEDARTLFHEFGHALHGLASNVNYPSVSGTSVARDYVEFPSQLLEHWLDTPEVLSKYALHYQTGKAIPDALVAKIRKASKFNSGFATVEYLSSALIDMKLHLAGDAKIDPAKFEKDTLTALGMPAEIVMRHRTPQFAHVFSGDGYSAGYYSYLWADTLTADAFEAFVEGKGPYDKTVADRLRKYVFSVGNTVDPADGYRSFRGKDAGISALMRKRGFPEAKPAAKPEAKPAAKPKKKLRSDAEREPPRPGVFARGAVLPITWMIGVPSSRHGITRETIT
jgi:peptidyl-dipeptidase Dcp